MASSILPSGEEIFLTPSEIKKYLNADGLRQVVRQNSKVWNLKVNRDADFYSISTLYKYSSDVHNDGDHQLIETRTFPDNGAKASYVGVHIDGGEFGYIHKHEQWNQAVTPDASVDISARMSVGVTHTDNTSKFGAYRTGNKEASQLYDSHDGRSYLLTNDELWYVNNEQRTDVVTSTDGRIPDRTAARMIDIPRKITDLNNDLDFVADWNHQHSDNNFSHGNRFLTDNMDDRTFVYPEISKDTTGAYVTNLFMGLNGVRNYKEGDGVNDTNRQSNITGNASDRDGAAVNSYNKNVNASQAAGYLPGVFKSLEELQKVDLLRQKKTRPDTNTPLWKRTDYYYKYDGLFNHNFYDRNNSDESFKGPNQNPANMYTRNPIEAEPTPLASLNQTITAFDYTQLFQWRYNRVTVRWHSADIVINVSARGRDYYAGDLLRYTYLDEVLIYKVDSVDSTGAIISGHNVPIGANHSFNSNPGTNGVPVYFSNYHSTGKYATFIISCRPRIHHIATQIKNNLYAYVDVVPTIRSNTQGIPFADDTNYITTDPTGKRTYSYSTAPAPAYSGLNKGRGVNPPAATEQTSPLAEHGGNATAGPHVHLFRYILDGTSEVVDGVTLYKGKWVDQGPLGLERPADIKALLFSNPDCNNFNNYYKFMIDIFFDNIYRCPDGVIAGTSNNNPTYTVGFCRIHVDQHDPAQNQKVYEQTMNATNNDVTYKDITDKTLWVNAGTRVMFFYNGGPKNDPTYGYGNEAAGWIPIAGTVTR